MCVTIFSNARPKFATTFVANGDFFHIAPRLLYFYFQPSLYGGIIIKDLYNILLIHNGGPAFRALLISAFRPPPDFNVLTKHVFYVCANTTLILSHKNTINTCHWCHHNFMVFFDNTSLFPDANSKSQKRGKNGTKKKWPPPSPPLCSRGVLKIDRIKSPELKLICEGLVPALANLGYDHCFKNVSWHPGGMVLTIHIKEDS